MSELDAENYGISAPVPKGRLVIGLVSPGKMGILCSQALASAGHILGFGYAHNERCVQRLKYFFPDATASNLAEIILLSDLIIIAVPQFETKKILHEIIRQANHSTIIFVISRLTEENLIAGLPDFRPKVMIVYPLINLAETEIELEVIRGSQWIVTAQSEIENVIAQSLVMELGGVPVVIAPELFPDFTRKILQFSRKIEQICHEAKMDISTIVHKSCGINSTDALMTVVDNYSDTKIAEEVLLPFMWDAISAAFKGNLPFEKFTQ